MCRLPEDTQRLIKACKGHYSLRQVAKYFGTSTFTVRTVWNDDTVEPAEDAPYIEGTPYTEEEILLDWPLLRSRGLSVEEAATHMKVSKSRLYALLGREAS